MWLFWKEKLLIGWERGRVMNFLLYVVLYFILGQEIDINVCVYIYMALLYVL